MDLFQNKVSVHQKVHPPLADRIRPLNLDEFVGQTHLVGDNRILRSMIKQDEPSSMILWGPPGSGKTTLAKIISHMTKASFFSLSAVTAGLSHIRKVIDQAKINQKGLGKRTILFIDEIHRFNKAQQDALLHSVEDGTLVFIGATTENPSFEVIAPLLSRCRIYRLNSLSHDEIGEILNRALQSDSILQEWHLSLSEGIKTALIHLSNGDARIALNGLELCGRLAPEKNGKRKITLDIVSEAMQKQVLFYDQKGDYHYDTISVFIKSMRGSDPDGAVYWLARMIESGEDPLFIARRMIILAAEDIGNSDPQALVLASATFQAVHAVGMPEARIILSQAATYLASAPKSNASCMAISKAQEDVRKYPADPVPLHLRNAPTGLMKKMGYGSNYHYAHDYQNGFVEQEYLPPRLKDTIYYHPKDIGAEKEIKKRLERLWRKRKNKT
ncbi:replication-associated recombination protein A [bacterium]|nr:replication-associated recombination protein A [bacterium]